MTVTTRSRVALADCEHALADFEASANTPYQRPRWVAVITLLRIVGHVLDKVDKPAASNEAQQRIDDAWKQLNATKPEPRIFHDFIDGDRNLLLKQYRGPLPGQRHDSAGRCGHWRVEYTERTTDLRLHHAGRSVQGTRPT